MSGASAPGWNGAARLFQATDRPAMHGSGALLVTPDGRYLLQQRDLNPRIWFSG